MAAAVETEITPYVLNHFIAGKSVTPATGDYLDKLDPRSGDRIARVANGNEADVDAAVRAAAAAFPEWRDRRPMDRAKVNIDPTGKIVVDTSKLFMDDPRAGVNQFNDPGAYLPV